MINLYGIVLVSLLFFVSLECLSAAHKIHHKHEIGRRSKVTNNETTAYASNTSQPISTTATEPTSSFSNNTFNSFNSTHSRTENAQKKSVQKKEATRKDMSAIVVIGNKTRRISGPVVKQLLSELQQQNEIDARHKTEFGESGSSNMKRIHAANEVAEINKLLGKPLTDAKALGLIKNLLLDKVHTHLAKTMDSELQGESAQIQPAQQPQVPVCRDLDPAEKCQYLKDMGLCEEGQKHPRVRKRCQQTCALCDPCSGCAGGSCPGCTTIRGWKVDIEIPMDGHQGEGHPHPYDENHVHGTHGTHAPLRRVTTPSPVFILDQSTPFPHALLEEEQPTIAPLIASTFQPVLDIPTATEMPLRAATPSAQHIALLNPSHSGAQHYPPSHSLAQQPSVHPTDSTVPLLGAIDDEPLEAPLPIGAVNPRPINPQHNGGLNGVSPLEGLNSALGKLGDGVHIAPAPAQVPANSLDPLVESPTEGVHPAVANPTNPMNLHQPELAAMEPMEQNRLPAVPPGSTAPVFTPGGQCQLPLDVGIAIDTSAATVPHFPQIQRFVKGLIDKFQLGGISRIGLITFDTIAKVPVPLGMYNDARLLKQHVGRLHADPYGRRRTDAALQVAHDRLFAAGRSGVPKILFLLEHGKINGGDPSINWSQMLSEPSQRLREIGVNVIAIGATPIAPVAELKTISSSADDSHSVPLQSYGQLPGVIPKVTMKACRLAEVPEIHQTIFTTLQPPVTIETRQQTNMLMMQPTQLLIATEAIIKTQSPQWKLITTLKPIIASRASANQPHSTSSLLGPYGCSVNFIKIGCYQDDQNNPRPLPEPIENDQTLLVPNGKRSSWNSFFPQFVCRCAMMAKKKGYKVFGVQNLASCWSGQAADQTYMEDGEADRDMCVSTDYQTCKPTDSVCVGKRETNYVYSLDPES